MVKANIATSEDPDTDTNYALAYAWDFSFTELDAPLTLREYIFRTVSTAQYDFTEDQFQSYQKQTCDHIYNGMLSSATRGTKERDQELQQEKIRQEEQQEREEEERKKREEQEKRDEEEAKRREEAQRAELKKR